MPVASRLRPRANEAILLGLLALLPAFFWRLTFEKFEVPKTALLVTAALGLGAWSLAGSLAAAAREGLGGSLGGAARRLAGLPRRDPLGAAVLLFVASAIASTLSSPNPALSLFGAAESTAGLRTALATAAVYFAARSLPGHPAAFDRIATAAAIGAGAAAGYALLQLAGLDPFRWGRTATFGGTLRVFGTLGHPNFLGGYLAMTLPLIAHLFARTRGALARAVLLALALASVATLAATLSRGAWIAGAAAAAAWIVMRPRSERGGSARVAARRGRSSAGLVALALALLCAAALLLARSQLSGALATRAREIASLRAPTTQSRLHIWRAGIRMAEDHPLLGVGLDAFGVAFPAYRTAAYWRSEWGGTPTKAHNEMIQIVATQGALGGLAVLLVILLAARAAWRAIRSRAPGARAAAVAATAALVGFAVQDLASFTVVALGALAASLAGWLAAAADAGTGPPAERSRSRRRPAWSLATAAALAAWAAAPLVVGPLRAQAAELRATRAPDLSDERLRALGDAEGAAPWDARYPAQAALLLLHRAQPEPDVARRRAQLEDARAAARRALRVEPESGAQWATLGRIEAERVTLKPPAATADDVSAAFRSALARDPENAQIFDLAAYALVQIGRTGEARAYEERSARLYPELAQPLALIGWLALGEGRSLDAVDTLRLAVGRGWMGETAAETAAWSNLAAGYISLGRYGEAKDAAETALTIDPGNAAARQNRAMAEAALREAAR